MGLLPLEFTDGLTDSPDFRETLQAHENELDRTSAAIKHLIKDIKDLIAAARNLSRAQRTLSETLNNFNFECIGNSQTDDELVIASSFKNFARLLSTIEDERDRLLEKADEAFLEPIERFRREQIGSAKEAKKKFDKETAKYCQNLERYLNMSVKKGETQLQEADANFSIEHWHFFKAMSEYVLKLQEVNERKKFEFVETVLSFMLGWLTFYHQGHEIATDFYSVKMELQMRLQRTRNNFNMTQEETKCLRQKMLNNKEKFSQKFQDSGSFNKMYTRQGYLFLMEKKAFTTSWTKHFCQYERSTRRLTIIQYTQTMGKILSTEEIIVKECIRRSVDSIDRRFCFDIVTSVEEKPSNGILHHYGHHSNTPNGSSGNVPNGSNSGEVLVMYTFQALSEEDFKLWVDALDGRDPYPTVVQTTSKSGKQVHSKGANDATGKGGNPTESTFGESYELDKEGYWFVRKCIMSIEERGLDQKGLYRVAGATSRVRSLMEEFIEKRAQSIARRKAQSRVERPGSGSSIETDSDILGDWNLDSDKYEQKTITSALKSYLRNLAEPIMTFALHNAFISAAKLENRALRIDRVHSLVHRLPSINFNMLKCLIEHLQKVSKVADKNLMTSSNLGVCFGPTLLRTAEESVAAIMEIKFGNVITELLIENYEKIFLTKPEEQVNSINAKGLTPVYSVDSAASIQQRPLPNVPNQIPCGGNMLPSAAAAAGNNSAQQLNHQNYPGSPSMLPSPNKNNSVFFFRVGNSQDSSRAQSASLATDSIYGSRQPTYNVLGNGIPMSGLVRRSSSQDQLYSVLNAVQQRNRPPYYQSNSTPQPILQHLQHSPHHLQGYGAPPTYAHLVPQTGSPRRSHLSHSSQSPSTISTSATTAKTYLGHQQQQQQLSLQASTPLQPIYQTQIVLKTTPVTSTTPAAIYGQHRIQPQMLQPSVSYHNLHYPNDIAQLATEMGNLALYNRPMTSMGILPMPNTTYHSAQTRSIDGQLEQYKVSPSPAAANAAAAASLGPSHVQQHSTFLGYGGQRPPSTLATVTQVRPYPLSSTSSAGSLSLTPEYAQPASQFAYRPSPKQSSVNETSMTPPPSGLIGYESNIANANTRTSIDSYQQVLKSHSPSAQQKQLQPNAQEALYSSIGAPFRTIILTESQSPLPSNKVRTRYVCIGGSESELSFQPNMIITNVRNSKEPGWLEGTLNGKTGLIPLNYVEFMLDS